MSGVVNNNNHPLLAKEVWAFFVYLVRGYFGVESAFFWRFGTVIFSIATLFVFFKILRIFFSNKVSFLGTIVLALDPMYFAFSRVVMLDIIALFFSLSSLLFLLKYVKARSQKDLIKGAIFLGLSLASKMAALSLISLIPIYLAFILKKPKKIFIAIFAFLAFIPLGFSLGNFLYFLLPHQIGITSYIYEIFSSQLNVAQKAGYLTSPTFSWFIIPQIITLFRVIYEDGVTAVLAFQNPLFFLLSIPTLVATLVLLIKGKLKMTKETILVLIFFLAQYVGWFFGLHPTYYFYIIPLIPLIILLSFKLIEVLKLKKLFYSLIVAISLIIFLTYYPLLTGFKVPIDYEKALFSYSQYKFPAKNAVFCQKCSPR